MYIRRGMGTQIGSLGSRAPHDIILFRIDYRQWISNQAADALSSPRVIVRG